MSDKQSSERERRDQANAARGDLVEGVPEEVVPRKVSQMLSLRLDGATVTALRALADQRGVTVSDLVRDAVALLLSAETTSATSYVTYFEVKSLHENRTFRSSDYKTGSFAPQPA
jgi:hypothetical protein